MEHTFLMRGGDDATLTFDEEKAGKKPRETCTVFPVSTMHASNLCIKMGQTAHTCSRRAPLIIGTDYVQLRARKYGSCNVRFPCPDAALNHHESFIEISPLPLLILALKAESYKRVRSNEFSHVRQDLGILAI
ncbi:hypothetical protein C8R41DRAFT_919759 [Lentinula lateritia]|uniref:Uncharacterized protein n=1 Tax=Lentinula lateritia TaxID=40482 RepID=A0ABQ8VFP0_9AGAR|nr:hypothetical protein C8R41DRAFT_919759 [Lentinula lateritia]